MSLCKYCATGKHCMANKNKTECKLYVPMTNEEYLRSCTTEQLAEFMLEHMDCIGCPASREICHRQYDDCKTAFLEWLKEKYE